MKNVHFLIKESGPAKGSWFSHYVTCYFLYNYFVYFNLVVNHEIIELFIENTLIQLKAQTSSCIYLRHSVVDPK